MVRRSFRWLYADFVFITQRYNRAAAGNIHIPRKSGHQQAVGGHAHRTGGPTPSSPSAVSSPLHLPSGRLAQRGSIVITRPTDRSHPCSGPNNTKDRERASTLEIPVHVLYKRNRTQLFACRHCVPMCPYVGVLFCSIYFNPPCPMHPGKEQRFQSIDIHYKKLSKPVQQDGKVCKRWSCLFSSIFFIARHRRHHFVQ